MVAGRRLLHVTVSLAIVVSMLMGAWSTMGLAAAGSPAPSERSDPAGATAGVGDGASRAPASTSSTAFSPGSSPLVVQEVERQIAQGRIDPRDVFLPSRFTHSGSPQAGPVSPTLMSVPAPMGLSDLGLGATGAYAYNTSSFAATLDLSSFSAYSPGYPALAEAPDWTSIQLNTIATNVSVPALSTGTFWVQNVVHFNGSSLQFEDNIWNFSSPTATFPSNTLVQSTGKVFLNEFYYAFGSKIYAVTDPFSLTLYNNLTTVKIAGIAHPVVFFNFTISDGAGSVSNSYDRVVFGGAVSSTPRFEVNGAVYNPFNSLYDAEITIGGDGGGSNANVQTVAGNLTLYFWNSTGSRYQHVRSAYDFGPDTGETSLGVAGYYLGNGGTEYLGPGPSMLLGLWNTTNRGFARSAASGWIHVKVSVSPNYAILFATTNTSYALPLIHENLSYVPTSVTGIATTDLPPLATGSYVFVAWANGYSSANLTATNSSSTQALVLTVDRTVVDAPVYLASAAQVAAYGAAGIPGSGWTGSNGTLWLNASTDTLVAPFLQLNDFDYPTFVLFAADDVNTSILISGFVQAPSTFTYTSDVNNRTASIPGWTQGYYFFGGKGAFSVASTTLTGNTPLFYAQSSPIVSAGAVEFYATASSHATAITVAQDSDGITAVNATGTILSRITSETGGIGVTAFNSSGLVAGPIAAVGADSFGFPSRAAYLGNDSSVTLTGISAANGSFGLDVANVTNWGTTGLVATNGSLGLMAQYASHGAVTDATVTGASTVGTWSNSSSISLNRLLVKGSFGISLVSTRTVTVGNVTVFGNASLGVPATGVAQFNNSTGGSFSNLSAIDLSIAFNATNSTFVNLTTVNATAGSIGAVLVHVNDVRANGISAANQSIALSWSVGKVGSIDGGTLGNSSVGVALANVTGVSVSRLAANESSVAAPYFFSPATGVALPTAPVAFDNVTAAFVGNISANAYPFGIWANFTNRTTIYNVTVTNGGIGVSVNVSHWVNISQVFAYGNSLGVVLFNATANNVTSSTIEDSRGWGIAILNSTVVDVLGNNFVANNNSSASGVFNLSRDQAYTNNSTSVHFSTTVGNYWSDYSGSGAYPIHNNSGGDAQPYHSFLYNSLQFVARGLPSGTPWGIIVLGVNFSSLDPLFYIPSYAVGPIHFPFTVNQTAGYLPSPVRGTIYFTGANQVVTITYTQATYLVTFTASGLPTGKSWSVTFGGTTHTNTTSAAGHSVTFLVGNGTYAYSITEPAGWVQSNLPVQGGTLPVNGAPVSETLDFTQYTYAVTFTEAHLPVGTDWSVTFNGTVKSGTGSSISFPVPNGTYSYSVGAIAGWNETTKPFSGSVNVQGSAPTLLLAWAPTFVVTFTETGLLPGSDWSVSLNGTSHSSTGTTITFDLTNATYGYSMPSVGNLSAPGGHVTVRGNPVSVSVTFAPTPPSTSPAFPWLYVAVGLAAVAVVVAIGALLLRRRGRAGGGPAEPPAPPET
jgi:Thermopsin/Periplasmic copper-binding protein (NosD)